MPFSRKVATRWWRRCLSFLSYLSREDDRNATDGDLEEADARVFRGTVTLLYVVARWINGWGAGV